MNVARFVLHKYTGANASTRGTVNYRRHLRRSRVVPVRGIGDAARHVAADFIVQPLNHRRTASAVTDTSGTATMNRAVMFP